MPSPHRRLDDLRRLLALGAAGACAVAGLAACGDDDDSDLAAYCDAEVALDQVFQNLDADAPGFDAALDDAQQAVDAVAAAAPDEVADPIDVRVEAFAAVRESGDPDRYFTDEVAAADDEIHA